MNANMLGFLGGSEMVVIFVIAAVFFGAKKLPDLARGLGKGIREFKKASSEVTDGIQDAMNSEPAPPPRRPVAPIEASVDDGAEAPPQPVAQEPPKPPAAPGA